MPNTYIAHCRWCRKTGEAVYPDEPPEDCIPKGWIGLRGGMWAEFCSRNCLVAYLLGNV